MEANLKIKHTRALADSQMRVIYSSVWTEGPPERPPPEIGKIVVEIWCYLPEVYTFGTESEIQEIFSKDCEKVNFP